MNVLSDAFSAALASLNAHRLRSFLTTLGILIGTAAVIAVVSLLQGLSSSIKSQFSDLGGGTLSLKAVNDQENFRSGQINALSFTDVDVLRYRVPGVGRVAPIMAVNSAGVAYRGRSTSPQLLATNAEFQLVQNRHTSVGRFITESDDLGSRRVAVIGTQDIVFGEIDR